MTEQIDRLRNSLLSIAERGFPLDKFLGKPEAMVKEVGRVRASFNSSTNVAPPHDRVLHALVSFIESRDLQHINQAGLISWGLTLAHTGNKPLIELAEPFSIFLDSIRSLGSNNTLPMKAWRGLLASYFSYSGQDTADEVGKENWKVLRGFLKSTFPSLLERRNVKPAWMIKLDEHLNLLDDNPCERYAASALQGDTVPTVEIQKILAIPQTSWVISELVRAQVKLACSFEESSYKQSLPQLAKTLQTAPLYMNMGLIQLLNRYSHCTDTSENSDLSRLAVEHWGNPKLPGNTKWGHVSHEIRAMVLKWLIGRDLETFFDLMTSDNRADQDQRRLKFWRRYLGSIQDAYFALGHKAWYSQNEDYVELRRRNEGRIAKLVHPDQVNNAFFMLAGEYVIVEFGAKGNACYCFDRDNLPFKLDVRQFAGDVTGLKSKTKGYKFHLSHIDRGSEDWEETFEKRLSELGIKPDQPRSISARRPQSRQKKPTDLELGSHPDSYHEPILPFGSPVIRFKIDELKDFVERFGLKVIDLRSRGGNLWVKPDCDMLAVQNQLRRWNFERKVGKGWWLR